MFTLLASILHLTNIRFVYDEETDAVHIEDEYPLEIGKKEIVFFIKNSFLIVM